MKSNIQIVTLATVLGVSVFAIGLGCKDRERMDTANAGDPSLGSYRTTGAVASADSSSRIRALRDDTGLTVGDQGSSPADRIITQQIRHGLTANTNTNLDYSVAAQNVKIITLDGKVTLRGAVKSDAEKNGIEALAKGVAGNTNVDDQLEVKP